jgi:choline transporter-like protein 2/4/5
MGGVNINEDIVIDKSIHKYINSHSAVLKVSFFFFIN